MHVYQSVCVCAQIPCRAFATHMPHQSRCPGCIPLCHYLDFESLFNLSLFLFLPFFPSTTLHQYIAFIYSLLAQSVMRMSLFCKLRQKSQKSHHRKWKQFNLFGILSFCLFLSNTMRDLTHTHQKNRKHKILFSFCNCFSSLCRVDQIKLPTHTSATFLRTNVINSVAFIQPLKPVNPD